MAEDLSSKRLHGLSLLGLDEKAGSEEIARKYQEQFNNLQMLLTNAPNPKLRGIYQKNLQDLDELKGILFEPNSDILNSLPSSTITYQQEEPVVPPPRPKIDPQRQKTAKNPQGLNPIGLAGWAVAILSTAIAVFFLNTGIQKDAKITGLETKIQDYEKNAWLFPYFENGHFELESTSMYNISISGIIVTYVQDNKIKKFYKQFEPAMILEPGKSIKLKEVAEINVIWDGSVVSYSLDLYYQGVQQTWSGLWKQDAPEKKLILNMD